MPRVGRKTENVMQTVFEKLSKYKLFYVSNYWDLDGVEISNYHGGFHRLVLYK